MKSQCSSIVCAFILVLSWVPSFASADEPALAVQVQSRVEEGLLKPLADFEAKRSRFSRARLPPRERRMRVTQTTETLDKAGHPFVPFAIDVKYGDGSWHENEMVGCAYMKTGDLFVKRGDAYRPASFLFGKSAEPVAAVCEPAPAGRS